MNEIEKTVADKEMRIKTLLVDIIGFLPMQICQNMMMFGENKLAENQAKDVRSKARNQKDQMNDIIVDFCTKCLKDPDTTQYPCLCYMDQR